MSSATAGIRYTTSQRLSAVTEDCSIVRGRQNRMLCHQRCCMSALLCMFGSLWNAVAVVRWLWVNACDHKFSPWSIMWYLQQIVGSVSGQFQDVPVVLIVYSRTTRLVLPWVNWYNTSNRVTLIEFGSFSSMLLTLQGSARLLVSDYNTLTLACTVQYISCLCQVTLH